MRTSFDPDSSQWPEVWRAAYRLLEQSEVGSLLRAWVSPLELEALEKRSERTFVRFLAPNPFHAVWIKDHFEEKMRRALEQVTGGPCDLDIVARAERKPDEEEPGFALREPEHPSEHRSVTSGADRKNTNKRVLKVGIGRSDVNPSETLRARSQKARIDESFVFPTFIVGASNQYSHASAVAVAEKPGHAFNPLFIYSYPGLGKTHLLHAIGNHVLAHHPHLRVLYLSAEMFLNELIESMQHHQMTRFREKYRNAFDMLLIDDIQFIAGKKSTEEEFFHTFNALYSLKKQIVVTSDRPPKEIEKLEERIRTRFEQGLVVDIQPPEIETRIAILKAKAEHDDIYLDDSIANLLAVHVKNNVRELEGVLTKLKARASLTGAEISLEMAQNELRDHGADAAAEITPESIQDIVSKHFGIRVSDLKSSSRLKNFALPRQVAMYLVRKYLRLGFKDIGELYFGGRDHTTVMHACEKIETAFDADPKVREMVENIQNQL